MRSVDLKGESMLIGYPALSKPTSIRVHAFLAVRFRADTKRVMDVLILETKGL